MIDLNRVGSAALTAIVVGIVCAGGGYWKGHHDADQSATVDKQAQQIRDLSAARDRYRQEAETQAGVARDAKESADQAHVAERAAGVAADGLRKQVANLVVAAKHSAASGGGSATDVGPDALDLLAGLFSRTDEAAGELARFADAAHIAGVACERSYDALTLGDK